MSGGSQGLGRAQKQRRQKGWKARARAVESWPPQVKVRRLSFIRGLNTRKMANHDAVFGRRREDECGLMLVRGQFSRGSQPRRRKRLQGAANRLCSGIRLNDAREGYSGLSGVLSRMLRNGYGQRKRATGRIAGVLIGGEYYQEG
jgi:hypothetical protein